MRQHLLGEVGAHDLAAGRHATRQLDRQVARAGGDVEDAVARADLRQVGRAAAPRVMQPGRHDRVHEVIDPRDAVEHRADLRLGQGAAVRGGRWTAVAHPPAPGSPVPVLTPALPLSDFRRPRNATRFLNFSGWLACSDLNDGMGAVGLISVRWMPAAGRRSAMSVSAGPGPPLPFSPILWHARQPDCAATCRPASYCWTTLGPSAMTDAGVGVSIWVGGPAAAPS